MNLDELASLIGRHRLRYGTEKQLQDDIERLLTVCGVPFTREHQTSTGPIDFLTEGIGIECKVDGGPSAILSQLIRYAAEPELTAIILVTSRRTHRMDIRELQGKPCRIVWVAANAL